MRHRLHHTRVDELESIDTRTAREVQDGPRTDEESYHQEKGSSTDVAEGEDEMRVKGQLPRRIEERQGSSRGTVRHPRRAMGEVGPWRPGLVVLPGRWTERVGCQISTSDTPRAGTVGPWSHPAPSPCHLCNKPTDDEARGITSAWRRCTRVARLARIYSRCTCGWMAERCMEIPLGRNYCRSREMHENETKRQPNALRCIVRRTFRRGMCRRVVARLEGMQTGQDVRQLESLGNTSLNGGPNAQADPHCSSKRSLNTKDYKRRSH